MPIDQTRHEEDTLFKVYEALRECNVPDEKAVEIVSSILNQGIIFRERI